MPSRTRVLQVVQPEDGGVAEHVLILSLGLRRRGFDVEVALSPASVIRPMLHEAGIADHAIPMVREPSRSDLEAALALRALDSRGQFDLVHAHSSKAGALVRLSLPRPERIAYTPHCFAFAMPGRRAARLLHRGVEQALVPRTGALIAVADWERRLAGRMLRGMSARVTVVRNGVGPCPAVEPDPQLREFAGDKPLAGMVAVLRPQKDPLTLVRAAAVVAEHRRGSHRVAIVGNGSLAGAVRSEIDRLGVSGSVRWFPFRGPVAPYLRALDVFVLPSLWEALPIAPIEAMSCGVPVVATRVGGTEEIVADGTTGTLVEPGRPEALAAALERFLGDPGLRRQMGKEARRVAAERFTVERMLDGTGRVYMRMLAGRRG